MYIGLMLLMEKKKLESCKSRIAALLRANGVKDDICSQTFTNTKLKSTIENKKAVRSPTGLSTHLISDLKKTR